MKQMISKITKGEEGSGLVLSLMVLIVLSVLGSALGIVTVGSYRLGNVNQDSNSAYYIAEAGANMAYEEIKSQLIDAYDRSSTPKTYFESNEGIAGIQNKLNDKEYSKGFFEKQSGIQPHATIKIEETNDLGNMREYTILSTGEVAGKTRTVSKNIAINWQEKTPPIPLPPLDAVITFKNKLVLGNSGTINGFVRHDGRGQLENGNSFTHNPSQGKKIDIVEDLGFDKYIKFVENFPEEPQTESVKVYNDEKKIVLSRDTYISDLKLDNNTSLQINTSGKNVYLVIENLLAGNGVSVDVKGTGQLKIYVKGQLSLGNSFSLNQKGNKHQIDLLYAGNKEVTMGNNTSINGTFYNNKQRVTFGNSLDITGFIISGGESVKMGNSTGTSNFIYAPKALIEIGNNQSFNGVIIADKLIFGNSATINGAIVATSIEFGNSATITYDKNTQPGMLLDSVEEINNTAEDLISAGPTIEQ